MDACQVPCSFSSDPVVMHVNLPVVLYAQDNFTFFVRVGISETSFSIQWETLLSKGLHPSEFPVLLLDWKKQNPVKLCQSRSHFSNR